jgi:hypothetical protein
MDRALRVLKDGHLLGEINFNYDSQTSGTVIVNVNKVVDIESGQKVTVPLYHFEREFSHQELNSITEIKAFDKTYFAALPDTKVQLEDGIIKFEYEPVHYRYVISTTDIVGITDIYADFSENQKELKLHSATHINGDTSMCSNSVESNIILMKRLCAMGSLNCPEAKFARVGGK